MIVLRSTYLAIAPIGSSVEVKMRRVFLVTAVCCVLASPVFAGGGVDLYATYGEVVDGEAELGLGVRLSIGGDNWLFDFSASGYQTVSNVQIVSENPYDNDSLKYRVFDLGLRYLFYDEFHKLRPYVGGGPSWATASATYARVDGALGFYGVAGLRYGKTPGIQFMGELIYRWAESDVMVSLGDQVDADLGGLALQVGVSFVF
jgi:hypothetical protein